jgi:hypothetical protein
VYEWVGRLADAVIFCFLIVAAPLTAQCIWISKIKSGTNLTYMVQPVALTLHTSIWRFAITRKFLKNLFPSRFHTMPMPMQCIYLKTGGIQTRDLLVWRRTRWPLCHAARAGNLFAEKIFPQTCRNIVLRVTDIWGPDNLRNPHMLRYASVMQKSNTQLNALTMIYFTHFL